MESLQRYRGPARACIYFARDGRGPGHGCGRPGGPDPETGRRDPADGDLRRLLSPITTGAGLACQPCSAWPTGIDFDTQN
ncbi:hypothetical protein DESC_920020 [Desulfosarcina cetonica]|nr:hypothetical protein DESC_920020 [Desulfosarcina cetonica]